MSFDVLKELLTAVLDDGHEIDAFVKKPHQGVFFVSIHMALVELDGELYLRDCHNNCFSFDEDIWKPSDIVVLEDKITCEVDFTEGERWQLSISTVESSNLLEYKEKLFYES